MMSLDFLGLGKWQGRKAKAPFRIAVPAFRMPEPKAVRQVPKGPLSREEVTAVFTDVLSRESLWTAREREEQAHAARIRAAIYS
ncbi:hypothetical protein LHP98_00790 [Rhodobacter sp. Har01]|uniref:hypothetical protein n=1 Tax=Rhodobacter sp. Har01 TaxID=2883999 RepID=UPI001D091BE6|nr:hypothetical protein [Rhodobacter sp. Har01]MCB6176663.1 hypothetical protein [Rhodobacter sp. Har01]